MDPIAPLPSIDASYVHKMHGTQKLHAYAYAYAYGKRRQSSNWELALTLFKNPPKFTGYKNTWKLYPKDEYLQIEEKKKLQNYTF